jgi:hypothetical protein
MSQSEPTEPLITELLADIAALTRELHAARLEHDIKITSLLSPEQHQRWKEIEKETKITIDAITETRDTLVKEAREYVLAAGEPIANDTIKITYVASGKTWDTGKLEGYAIAHPEINACAKEKKATTRVEFLDKKE